MSYDIDFNEEAQIKDHIRRFLLYPPFWTDMSNILPIKLQWKRIRFTASNASKIPSEKGVYAFVLLPKYKYFFETSYLFYVGKTNRELKERFKEYLNEKEGKGKPRKKIHKMLNIYDGHLYFFYATIGSRRHVDRSETAILNTFIPHINTRIPRARVKHELKNIYEG